MATLDHVVIVAAIRQWRRGVVDVSRFYRAAWIADAV